MSKNCNETYDVTEDAVNDTLSRMKAFYDTHPVEKNPNDSVAFYEDRFFRLIVKGWKEMECTRHPYDYNHQMAAHSDKSPATLRRIYNKK